jgi:glycerol-3-phosphate acyltransferase PlsY
LAKRFAGTDVRTLGSGNIGATNVTRVVGKKLGALTLVLDALKAAAPVWLALFLMGLSSESSSSVVVEAAGLVGLCAVVGHCFPVWLRFKGGKGVACGLGLLLALEPASAGVGLVVFVLAFAVSRVVSASSLLAAVVAISYLAYVDLDGGAVLPLLLTAVVIVAKHHDNIRRLWKREELRV